MTLNGVVLQRADVLPHFTRSVLLFGGCPPLLFSPSFPETTSGEAIHMTGFDRKRFWEALGMEMNAARRPEHQGIAGYEVALRRVRQIHSEPEFLDAPPEFPSVPGLGFFYYQLDLLPIMFS